MSSSAFSASARGTSSKLGRSAGSSAQQRRISCAISAGKRPDPHDVPLPLLFRASREVNASSQERIHRIFFRGSCTSKLRNRLARDVVAPETLAVDVGRCGQGGKSKYPDYAENLQKSLFVLAPRGSYPATFMLGEAVQAGALAVYVYEARFPLAGKRGTGGFRRAPAANEPHLSPAASEAQPRAVSPRSAGPAGAQTCAA